jgi:hypothetical protein
MLAEKFFLMLEALIRAQVHPDGSPRVMTRSPFVPMVSSSPLVPAKLTDPKPRY